MLWPPVTDTVMKIHSITHQPKKNEYGNPFVLVQIQFFLTAAHILENKILYRDLRDYYNKLFQMLVFLRSFGVEIMMMKSYNTF